MRYPAHLLCLIETFKKLPGVGMKSAERFAFELLRWPAGALEAMGDAIAAIPQKLTRCSRCCAIAEEALCPICSSPKRNRSQLCLVASGRDLFSIEATGEYRGTYHVLGALLSPMEGVGPNQLPLEAIRKRISDEGVRELIIAVDATLEGDTTALYLKEQLEGATAVISRLAFGLPMGSALDYVDGGTLARALVARSHF